MYLFFTGDLFQHGNNSFTKRIEKCSCYLNSVFLVWIISNVTFCSHLRKFLDACPMPRNRIDLNLYAHF